MAQVCVDANLVVMWIAPEEGRDKAVDFLSECQESGISLVAPDCVFAEVGASIRRKVYRQLMDEDDGFVAISILERFAIDIVPLLSLIKDAWQLASQYNLPTLYDAYYLAVAQRQECDFWTADQRFLSSIPTLPYVRDIRGFSPGTLER